MEIEAVWQILRRNRLNYDKPLRRQVRLSDLAHFIVIFRGKAVISDRNQTLDIPPQIVSERLLVDSKPQNVTAAFLDSVRPFFPFPWRRTFSAKSGEAASWDTDGHIIEPPSLDNCWNANAVLWRGVSGGRPRSTQGITLLARFLHYRTPIECLLEACPQISMKLTWWLTLQLRP